MRYKCKAYFDVSFNKLISLEGSPEFVGRDFICFKNKRIFKIDDVNKVCKVVDYIVPTPDYI